MKSKQYTSLTLACATALTACAGGTSTYGGSSPAAPATPAGLSVNEFLGAWAGNTTVCKSGFPYGNYFHRLTTLVLTEKGAEATQTAYTDAACTAKAGRVIEKYDVSWSGVSIAGKSNVARATLNFSGSMIGADGDTGFLQLNKMPNGSTLSSSGKLLLDVDGAKLYGPADGAALDADGFATALSANSFASKQP